MTDRPDPREALDAIAAARQSVPGEIRHSLLDDVAYGLVCGLLVAGQGLDRPWSFVALVVSLTGLFVFVHLWRRKYGWWVSGYSPRKARWVAIAMAAGLVGLMGLSIWGKAAGIGWTPLATGAAGFVLAIVGSRIWMAVWKRELAEEAQ
ncbi:MAG: hypothetical protein ACK4E3_11940 [Brevundimonas sp.]|uniref:hypothetical protein n=1 Tax=Brevundimonas sp. TaxID=1871086 RepID=UPI00391D57FE